MDALDEFFATWCEAEAWCEMCGDYPAIHVVLRDTAGKYGGVMSHVRVWNPAVQRRVPVCRQCCRDQVQLLGQSVQYARALDQQRQSPSAPFRLGQQRLSHWLHRLFQRGQHAMRHLFPTRRHPH
jgi:hypothetical protein